MKINFKKTQGNVLFGTLFTTGIICLYLGSYLSMVSSENRITTRSQTWNMAIPVAEAGVEEAMSHLKATYLDLKASNGWTNDLSDTYLLKTQWLNSNEFYTVGIVKPKTATDTPVIISQGFARPPMQTDFLSRTIRVNTQRDGNEIPGLVVVTTAVMNGNKLVVDSYNSTNNAFSTDGRYDPLKRGDKALLATLSRTVGSVDLGNMDVWGKVASGYNGGPPKGGPQSSVGDKAWHDAGKKGIQPGHYSDDVNLTFEPPTAPYETGLPAIGHNGSLNLDSGQYLVDKLEGNVHIRGDVTLVVTKTFKIESLRVSNPTGTARLKLYVAASDVDLSNGKLNVEGRASNFKYYGLPANPARNWPGNKTLSVGGNGEMTGIFNAPETVMTFSGSGRDTQDFSGAALCKAVVMRGTYSFHFDESIGQEMVNGYTASTWDEINADWSSILSGNVAMADVLNDTGTYVLNF